MGNNYWVQRPDGRLICGGFRHLVSGGEEGIDDDAELSRDIMESDLGPRRFLEQKFILKPIVGQSRGDATKESANPTKEVVLRVPDPNQCLTNQCGNQNIFQFN